MKQFTKAVCLMLIVCSIFSCSKKTESNFITPGQAKIKVQAMLDSAVVNDFPGLSVSVNSSSYTYTVFAGKSSLPNTDFFAGTLNYMHSISKTFTAVSVLKLKEQGLVNLDANMSQYLSATICNNITNGNSITVRQLLNMRSGIADYLDNPQFFIDAQSGPLPMPSSQMLQYVYNQPAHFAPGSQYEYTNINYHLLALIIDAVTRGNHHDFITSNIISQYGLTQTFYVPQSGFDAAPANTASAYSLSIVPNQRTDVSELQFGLVKSSIGDDGIICSTSDMVRFYKLLLQDKSVVNAVSLKEMTGPDSTLGKNVYGMGLISYRLSTGQLAIGHNGGFLGANAYAMYFPEKGVTITLATNIGSLEANDPVIIKFHQLFDKIAKQILEAN